MKKTLSALAIGLAAFSFTACEETTFDVALPFEHVITNSVDIPAGENSPTVMDTTKFDATVDPDLEDKIDKVSSLQIKEVVVDVTNLNRTDSLEFVTASAVVKMLFGPALEVEVFNKDLFGGATNLQQLVDQTPITFTAEELGVTNIDDLLSVLQAGEGASFISAYSGSNGTATNISFDAKVTVKFDATASLTGE